MSFLAPLYAAGILAVSLPILFHLVRRTPRGRVTFSSLMFLSPTPPRVTRRSRLENLWLLFLRGLAICLLALAFARPFFRDADQTIVAAANGERVVLLVDTSASMRRDGVWEQAVKQTLEEVDRCASTDEMSLVAFDSQVRPLLTFTEWNNAESGQRLSMVRSELDDIEPSWRGTHFDAALMAAADLLARSASNETSSHPTAKRIVIISDLQQGGRLTGLQSHRWPADIQVSIVTVEPGSTTNAAIQMVATDPESQQPADTGKIRVRVENAGNSQRDRFQLAWGAAHDNSASVTKVDVYVPAGQSRIVQAPPLPAGMAAGTLTLFGDDHPFDNSIFYVAPQPAQRSLWYLGDDSGDDPQQPRYFVERALADTPVRHVEILTSVEPASGEPPSETITLAVVTAPPTPAQNGALKQFLHDGGTVLLSLRSAAAAETVSELTGGNVLAAEEADGANYAMLGDIQFDHPLFASFSEARFSDFTKIHFWKHRRIDESALPGAVVLARFDDGAAALVETRIGAGTLLLLTAGWHPEDSQLALSSKFAPLLNAILERAAGVSGEPGAYAVGDTVECTWDLGSGEGDVVLTTPDATHPQLAINGRATDATSVPGIYRFQQGDRSQAFAVNLSPQESRTAPLLVEQFEQLGLVLHHVPTAAELADQARQQRQLKNRELESRQKVWHWLILATLLILILETWWAGRTAQTVLPAA